MLADLAIANTHTIPEALVQRSGDSLGRVLRAFSAWRRRRKERAELYVLSDLALKDFGINRAEIEWIVRSADRDASGRVR
jgi:uncharacterized protein YjiS (DUF1127 family)